MMRRSWPSSRSCAPSRRRPRRSTFRSSTAAWSTRRSCSSDGAKRALENKLANLEAHTSKQLIVVTLASARGMTVDDYGLELRKHWGLEANGKRVMLIVGPSEGRSVIQFDTSLKRYPRPKVHRAHSRTDDEAALQRRRLSRRRGGGRRTR